MLNILSKLWSWWHGLTCKWLTSPFVKYFLLGFYWYLHSDLMSPRLNQIIVTSITGVRMLSFRRLVHLWWANRRLGCPYPKSTGFPSPISVGHVTYVAWCTIHLLWFQWSHHLVNDVFVWNERKLTRLFYINYNVQLDARGQWWSSGLPYQRHSLETHTQHIPQYIGA
jgi:hypothetical protein